MVLALIWFVLLQCCCGKVMLLDSICSSEFATVRIASGENDKFSV